MEKWELTFGLGYNRTVEVFDENLHSLLVDQFSPIRGRICDLVKAERIPVISVHPSEPEN